MKNLETGSQIAQQAQGPTGALQKDTLQNLFLSHLLRPREWTAQYDGSGYFAFRKEHIVALADEC